MFARLFLVLAVFFVLLWLGGRREAPASVPGLPPPGLQSDPAAAADDSVLYAVWTDGRLGPSARLFWTRFDQPVPDTLAGPLTEGGASELRPAVAAGPGWALALWEAWTASGVRVQAAELSPAGAPGPRPVWTLTPDPGPVWRPAAAVAGEVGVLVWEDERLAPGDLYFTCWDHGLGPREPGGAPFAVGPEDQRWVRVAAGPAGFAAVWAQSEEAGGYRIMARGLDATGRIQGPMSAVSGLEPFAPIPDLAWGEQGFLVVWRMEGLGGGDLAGRYLGPAGDALGPGPFPLVEGPGLEFFPRVAPADSGYALAWLVQDETGRALRRAWVREGELAPAEGLVLGPGESYCADPALAGWGSRAAALWRVPLPEDDDDLLLASFDPAEPDPVVPLPLTLITGALGLRETLPPVRLRAHPNPFADRVRMELPVTGQPGPLDIFDVRGRRIRRLWPAAGAAVWDGRDDLGAEAAPGVYFVRTPGSGAGLRLVRIPR